jgi:phage terminase large subunit-like protein
MRKGVKYKAHNKDFTKFLWPERFNKEFFIEKREEYARIGLLDLYSQEYLNYPIDEGSAYYRKQDFQKLEEEHKKRIMRFYVTVDLAISQDEKADYSAFLIAGVDEERKIHIEDCIKELLDAREIIETYIPHQ